MDPLVVDIIVTVLAALAYMIGLAGIIVPVLPGTILIMIATLIWAIFIGGWPAWVAFGLVMVFGTAGMATSWILTGRRLNRHDVPMWPILVGLVAGIIGIFVIPFLGLPIGFLIGLYGSEWYRQRDLQQALASSWVAMKALGIGIIIELSLAFLSTITFAAAVVVHFVTL